LFVLTENEVIIWKDKQIICYLNVRNLTEFKWNFNFSWLDWELDDLNLSIKLLSDIEDRKID